MLSRSARDQSLLNAYWIPLNFQGSALLAIAVPAALLKFPNENHTQQLAVLASVVAAISMLLPPPIGALSDYLRRRGGHRRPFILFGAALNVAGLIWMAFTTSLLPFAGALVVASIGQALSNAAYQALIPEVVPREDWGHSAGYQGIAALVGSVAGLAVASITSPQTTFLWTALIVGLGGITVVLTPEGRWTEPDHVHVSDWHNFRVVFASRFFTNIGLTLLSTFALYFFRDVQKSANPSITTGLFGILALVGAIVTAFWTGSLSDRVPRKYIIAIASIPMALVAGGFAIAPYPHLLVVYAICFGLGFGAFLSVGWALAIDAVPQMRDVARDLGIWGIASGLPNVIAPVLGGWLLAQYLSPLAGYRALFLVAGATFVLGAIVVLFVHSPAAKRFPLSLQAFCAAVIWPYYHLLYRIRSWGELPRERGATLVLSNHQHGLDTIATVMHLVRADPPNRRMYITSSRRLYERGFLGVHLSWLEALLRTANTPELFDALGCLPIENELRTRALLSLAGLVNRNHPGVKLGDVFPADLLTPLGPDAPDKPLAAVFSPRLFRIAEKTRVPIKRVHEPYRSEILADARANLEGDLQRFESALRDGETVYLTPEGHFSTDGRFARMRASFDRLVPLGTVYIAALSYDVFVGRRLSLLFRIVSPEDPNDLVASMKAARPVTVSQLLADWLANDVAVVNSVVVPSSQAPEFTETDAIAAVRERLAALPAGAFVDPELARSPDRMTEAALRGMQRLKIITRNGTTYRLNEQRRRPEFPHVPDIVVFQANFFAETIDAWRDHERRNAGQRKG